MAKGKITAKQQEILDYIKSEILTRGYPPAVREICEAVHLKSTSSVHSHLETLEKNGYIRRDPTKPRALEIIDNSIKKEMVNVPIIGKVTAGIPILANENVEDIFPLPLNYIKHNDELFMLNISGNSMINAGIFDGDLAIIEKCQTARNGDIVVALIENEATLKRFYREDGHIRLQPENDNMDAIIVDNCIILGKLVGLFRTY